MNRDDAGRAVANALAELAATVFTHEAKLTFAMRLPGDPQATMVVTDDDLAEVAEVIARSEAIEHEQEPTPTDADDARHCDWVIRDTSRPMALRMWLFVRRLPALDKWMCEEAGIAPSMYARHDGRWCRLVMASRMGDVGISYDLDREHGYDVRLCVDQLADFTVAPPIPGEE